MPSPELDKVVLHPLVQHLVRLTELVDNLGEAIPIQFLLLLLLTLCAVGHRDLPVVLDLLLKASHQGAHLVLLAFHALPEIVVVAIGANLILHLYQLAKTALEFRKLAFDPNILFAQSIWNQLLLVISSWIQSFLCGGIVRHSF